MYMLQCTFALSLSISGMQTVIHIRCFCAHHFVDDVSFLHNAGSHLCFKMFFPPLHRVVRAFMCLKNDVLLFKDRHVLMYPFWVVHFIFLVFFALGYPFFELSISFFVLFLLYYVPFRIFSLKRNMWLLTNIFCIYLFAVCSSIWFFLLLVDWCQATRTKEPYHSLCCLI